VPKGTSIIELQETPRLTTAKGETLSVLGTCELFVKIAGETSSKTTGFIFVSQIVVTVLFGTPWISDNVIRIEPRIREVHIAYNQIEIYMFRCWNHPSRLSFAWPPLVYFTRSRRHL
jgi:hypothetical protein